MKPATKSAVATVINNPDLEKYFKHDGLRTVLCAYAMHAVTTRWLGYSTLNNEVPLFVDEIATHSKDLDWTDINDLEEIRQTAETLGTAMGLFEKIEVLLSLMIIYIVFSQPKFIALLTWIRLIERNMEHSIRI